MVRRRCGLGSVQGIVGGYGDGSFSPDDDATREQTAAMLMRLIERCGA